MSDKSVPKVISNSAALEKEIQKAAREYIRQEKIRDNANAIMKSARANLKAKGIDPQAFVNEYKSLKNPKPVREEYTYSVPIVRAALIGIQSELFAEEGE